MLKSAAPRYGCPSAWRWLFEPLTGHCGMWEPDRFRLPCCVTSRKYRPTAPYGRFAAIHLRDRVTSALRSQSPISCQTARGPVFVAEKRLNEWQLKMTEPDAENDGYVGDNTQDLRIGRSVSLRERLFEVLTRRWMQSGNRPSRNPATKHIQPPLADPSRSISRIPVGPACPETSAACPGSWSDRSLEGSDLKIVR